MPIERLVWLAAAVSAVMLIVAGGAFAVPFGWDKAAHFVVYSALTFALWHATGGEMPLFVVGAVIVLAGLDEWRQAYLVDRMSDAGDLLADIAAASTTAGLLFLQRRTACAESSPR